MFTVHIQVTYNERLYLKDFILYRRQEFAGRMFKIMLVLGPYILYTLFVGILKYTHVEYMCECMCVCNLYDCKVAHLYF